MKMVRISQLLAYFVLFALLFGSVAPSSAGIPTVSLSESSTYQEAPMLAAMVAAGQIPLLEQRLPTNPVVVTPVDSVGQYGGTWHTASRWSGIDNVLMKIYDPPVRWKADYSGYEPGLAESYEWSTDGYTFTLHLREGIRWSHGETYTSEDWRFWWEDMALNGDYTVVTVPFWLQKSDGTPVDMQFPDDYTVVWISDRAQWVLPFFMAQGFWGFANPMMKPAHYLKQYHPTYTPGATYDDLEAVDMWWENPEFPTVFAWHCKSVEWVGGVQVTTFERNPYYWKVDTEGNQLPYIDYLKVELIPDYQDRLVKVSQGQYDAAFRVVDDPDDIPFLEANAAANGYHLQSGWMNGAGAWPGYMVNMDYVEGGGNYPDDTPEHAAEIRTLFRDKRFRKALSVGFNRQDVINAAWTGIGTPQQATISPQSRHFASPEGQLVFQEWAASDAGFDATQANTWLDDIGMVDSNSDGWRDLPSGIPFTLIIDVSDWGGYEIQMEAAEEIEDQWETNLKIQVEINSLSVSEAESRERQGYYMLRAAHVAELDVWTYPDWVFPVRNTRMFPLEGLWYETGGLEGMEPEPGSPAAQLQSLYDQGLAEPDVDARHEIVWDAIQIHMDEGPFVIGVSGDQPMPVVIKDYFHNVPEYGVLGPWAPGSPGNMHSEQFWIEPRVYLPMIVR